MFLTDNYSIREVLAFPFLREEKTAHKDKPAAELVGVEPMPVEEVRKCCPNSEQRIRMMVSRQVANFLLMLQPASRCMEKSYSIV